MKKSIYLLNNRHGRRLAKKHLSKKNGRGGVIVLMAIPQAIRVITGTLNMPDGNAERGARAKEITDACEVSTYVSVPAPTITSIRGHITDYNNSTPATRDNNWRVMHNDMKALLRLFQDAADADPQNAEAILKSGKFGIKAVGVQQKHVFGAENSPVSGTVYLHAEGGPAHSCHDWKYSADGVNFTRLYPTVEAHTFKDGLVPRSFAYFTHELITKNGPQGVSQIIKIEVK